MLLFFSSIYPRQPNVKTYPVNCSYCQLSPGLNQEPLLTLFNGAKFFPNYRSFFLLKTLKLLKFSHILIFAPERYADIGIFKLILLVYTKVCICLYVCFYILYILELKSIKKNVLIRVKWKKKNYLYNYFDCLIPSTFFLP